MLWNLQISSHLTLKILRGNTAIPISWMRKQATEAEECPQGADNKQQSQDPHSDNPTPGPSLNHHLLLPPLRHFPTYLPRLFWDDTWNVLSTLANSGSVTMVTSFKGDLFIYVYTLNILINREWMNEVRKEENENQEWRTSAKLPK